MKKWGILAVVLMVALIAVGIFVKSGQIIAYASNDRLQPSLTGDKSINSNNKKEDSSQIKTDVEDKKDNTTSNNKKEEISKEKLLNYLLGKDKLDKNDKANADYNGDGTVNLQDYIDIERVEAYGEEYLTIMNERVASQNSGKEDSLKPTNKPDKESSDVESTAKPDKENVDKENVDKESTADADKNSADKESTADADKNSTDKQSTADADKNSANKESSIDADKNSTDKQSTTNSDKNTTDKESTAKSEETENSRIVYLDVLDSGWETAYIYTWKGGEKFTKMTSVNGKKGVYKVELPKGVTEFLFINNNQSKWDNGNQTINVKYNADKTLYSLTKLNGEKYNGEWSVADF